MTTKDSMRGVSRRKFITTAGAASVAPSVPSIRRAGTRP
jgi:hypothetical protein